MTYEEIDERYRDAALDDDDEGEWEDETPRETSWDDPAEVSGDDDGADDDGPEGSTAA